MRKFLLLFGVVLTCTIASAQDSITPSRCEIPDLSSIAQKMWSFDATPPIVEVLTIDYNVSTPDDRPVCGPCRNGYAMCQSGAGTYVAKCS